MLFALKRPRLESVQHPKEEPGVMPGSRVGTPDTEQWDTRRWTLLQPDEAVAAGPNETSGQCPITQTMDAGMQGRRCMQGKQSSLAFLHSGSLRFVYCTNPHPCTRHSASTVGQHTCERRGGWGLG